MEIGVELLQRHLKVWTGVRHLFMLPTTPPGMSRRLAAEAVTDMVEANAWSNTFPNGTARGRTEGYVLFHDSETV
eukprot:14077975-Alexandrium_andersonii.AAC.1